MPTEDPSNESLNKLQSAVQNLQNVEQENQKLQADFAAYSESMARSLAQATERINELEHMVLNLLKTAASLSRDHKQLHYDFIDQATERLMAGCYQLKPSPLKLPHHPCNHGRDFCQLTNLRQ